MHNHGVDEAVAGMRTAINFQGLEKESVQRGNVVARPGTLISSHMVDVQMRYLPGNQKPLKNHTRVRFHTGTDETMGNAIPLDREELLAGESAFVQLRLDTPVTVAKDDRFVIRSYSPVHTIGGGRILNPVPRKHKRFDTEIIEGLEYIAQGDIPEMISFQIHQAGYAGLSATELIIMTNLAEKQLDSELQNLLSQKTIIRIDRKKRTYLHQRIFEKLTDDILQQLAGYHEANPLKTAMPKEELKSKLPSGLDPKLFTIILTQLMKTGELVQDENTVRLAEHSIALAIDQEAAKKKIIGIYLDTGLTPPVLGELIDRLGIEASAVRDVLQLLVEEKQLVKIKNDLFFHEVPVTDLKNRLVDFLMANGEITTPQFKEMTGASRKYTIPLIEFFDSQKVTIRVGDNRQLRSRN